MSNIYTIKAPYFVKVGKRRFACNLNTYRNSHYRITNEAKKEFKRVIKEQVEKLPTLSKIAIHYIVHYENSRKYDIDNIVSVVSKFFQDAIVELGKLPDDNFEHIVKIIATSGATSRNDGYVEIRIKEVK